MELTRTRDFPDGTIVSAPATVHVPGDSLVFVRVTEPEQIAPTLERYGPRLAGWEIEGGAVSRIETWTDLAQLRARVHVDAMSKVADEALLEKMAGARAQAVLAPGPDLLRLVNLLTSHGVSVRVDSAPRDGDAQALDATVAHYLHAASLTVPIEPFHGLLLGLSTGSGRSLWELESEEPDLHFYVTDDGQVTLSRRFADAERTYGSANDPWDRIVHSALYQELSSLPATLTSGDGPCASCPHAGKCRGFLRAVDVQRDCTTWQDVFATLEDAYGKAQEILAEAEGKTAPEA